LTVTAGGVPSITLHIKGNVTKKPEDFTVTYPQSFGDLRAKNKRDFSFAQISSQQATTTQIIDIANAGDKAVKVTFENVPEYIVVNAIPDSLGPRQKGQITIGVNGAKRKKFGYINDKITVKTGKSTETISVTSIVAEKIEPATDKIPVSEIIQSTVDLGTLTENKVSSPIEIRNIGNADLVIKSFTADNDAFTVAMKKEIKIKAGKTGTIKLSANNLQKGSNVAQLYLSTNDPAKSLLRVTVKADVQ
jgi:hypothetical protein